MRGAKSFEDLRTVDCVIFSTFREATQRRGLIEDERSISDCLSEAAAFQMPSALRRLFATILVFCEVTNVRELWDKHFEAMGDDFRRENVNAEVIDQMVLKDLRSLLYSMGKDIKNFDLPCLLDDNDLESLDWRELYDEMFIEVEQEHLDLYNKLNNEQRLAFDEIMTHVLHQKSMVFFHRWSGRYRKNVPL